MRSAFAIVSLIVLVAGVMFAALSSRHVSVINSGDSKVPARETEEVRLLFVGDIMLSRAIGKIMAGKKDHSFPFASTTEFIRSADVAFANLESPVSERGVKSGSIYSFRAKLETVHELKAAGFDVVSVANNHIWDYGSEAFRDTLAHLSENGIAAAGGGESYDEAHTPKVITVRRTRIAFLAYTNLLPASLGHASSTPAVARFGEWNFSSYDEKNYRAGSTTPVLVHDIQAAKAVADIVVVSFHWGDEYQTKHNTEQERIAKLSIDAGADIIVGHHPHVVQEAEEYNGGYIFYSLGNFIFDQNFSKDTKHGLVVAVTLKDSEVASIVQKQVLFSDDFQPYFPEEAIFE